MLLAGNLSSVERVRGAEGCLAPYDGAAHSPVGSAHTNGPLLSLTANTEQ